MNAECESVDVTEKCSWRSRDSLKNSVLTTTSVLSLESLELNLSTTLLKFLWESVRE